MFIKVKYKCEVTNAIEKEKDIALNTDHILYMKESSFKDWSIVSFENGYFYIHLSLDQLLSHIPLKSYDLME